MKYSSPLVLLLSTATLWAQTTIGTFTGGDPGEGLDLQGNFTYAVNVGTGGAAGKAGDAQFTADNTPGVVVLAVNEIPGWHTANYGSTADDDVIEMVMRSIRWSPAPSTVIARLAVEAGVHYKLQLLFAENCCPNRGFDVKVEGEMIADEFNPGGLQGDPLNLQGAVITHEFTAGDAELEIELDGNTVETPEFTDHNAIFNGFTLERLSASGDVDGDGLPDDWEMRIFGNLNQRPTDDPDGDTLDNAREFALTTNPNDTDTDDDTLTDDAEVNTHLSNPTLRDTDGDRL
ncbi:MAG TPA: hypothetical protein DCE44_12855, partial [Verrucomicrobiales bacterium]|nr:hypothetical protein [Verrucomicrobiales bacterium]